MSKAIHKRQLLLSGGVAAAHVAAARLADAVGLGSVSDEQLHAQVDMLQAGAQGTRLGGSAVAWVDDQVELLSKLDDEVGSSTLRPVVQSHLVLARQLFKAGSVDHANERAMRLGMARLHRLAAWLEQDSGNAVEADRNYRLAIDLARAEGDRDFAAYCMAMMGFQAVDKGLPAQCLSLLEAAEEEAVKDAPFQVIIAQWAVQPLALLGRQSAAVRCLNRADALWETHDPDRVQDWMYWMYRPSLTPEVPRGFIQTDPALAADLFRGGLDALSNAFPRDRVMFQVGLAEALVAADELDEALTIANNVLRVSAQISAPRAVERLRVLASNLPESSAATAFREQLYARLA